MEPFAPWDAPAPFLRSKNFWSRLRSSGLHFLQRKKMEPTVGIEPTTYGLQNRCSAS